MRISLILIIMALISPLVSANPDFKNYSLAGINLTGGLDFSLVKHVLGNVETYRNEGKKAQSSICYYSKDKDVVFIYFQNNMGRGFIMRRPVTADLERCGPTDEANVHINGIRLGDTHYEYLKEVKAPIRLKTLERIEHVYAENAQLTNIEIKRIYKKSFQNMKWDSYIKLIEHAGEVVDIQADFKNTLLINVLIWYSIQF